MTRRSGVRDAASDLHGSVPDRSDVALLLIDVINDFEFAGAQRMIADASRAARQLAGLADRARKAGVPCIYANDNFGRWRSDFTAQVRHCVEDGTRGAKLAELLAPRPEDYFVLKPKHSAFYATCLGLLLDHLGARQLIVGGFATDSCVSFTCADAYLRGHQIILVSDGTVGTSPAAHTRALTHMRGALRARVVPARRISLIRAATGPRLRIRARG